MYAYLTQIPKCFVESGCAITVISCSLHSERTYSLNRFTITGISNSAIFRNQRKMEAKFFEPTFQCLFQFLIRCTIKSKSEDVNRVFPFSIACSMKSCNYLIFLEIVFYCSLKLCFVGKIVQMTNNTHNTEIVLYFYFLSPISPYTTPFKEKRTFRFVTCIFCQQQNANIANAIFHD